MAFMQVFDERKVVYPSKIGGTMVEIGLDYFI